MGRLKRLLRYFKPYWLYLLASVISMALVGLLDAFRLLLIGPVLDQVLNPASQARALPLLPVPVFGHRFDLRLFVPAHLHNVWSVVAFALVRTARISGGRFDDFVAAESSER